MRYQQILKIMLALVSLTLSCAILSCFAWYRSASKPASLEDLTSDERQRLVEKMLSENPGVFRPAFFHPAIGYTLRPGVQHEVWNDRFVANELGYRTGAPAKTSETFRVVFVGDSWTYGHGVSEAESFPKVFERLANQYSGLPKRVEAWNLALPGYNTFNELAALWYFFELLEPDAVIICPSTNDQHSTAYILPNGSPWRNGLLTDLFGDPHSVTYRLRFFDSVRFRQRWSMALTEIVRTQERLARLTIPSYTFFTAVWSTEVAHGFVEMAGMPGPYSVVPGRYCVNEWTLPPPLSHGTATAQSLYGRILYAGFAKTMDWGPAPPIPEVTEQTSFDALPTDRTWAGAMEHQLLAATRHAIPESFHPSAQAVAQCAGPIEASSGRMGRATTILVRRREGATRLVVTLQRIADAPSLYPLRVSLTIPTASERITHSAEVFAHAGASEEVEISIPGGLRVGSALDVIIEAEHVVKSSSALSAASVDIASITQR